MLRKLVKIVLGESLSRWMSSMMHPIKKKVHNAFMGDYQRFWRGSGISDSESKGALLARIIMGYHVLEKGLTMPNRRSDFGQDRARALADMVRCYFGNYDSHPQVRHAVAVLKEYRSVNICAEWLDEFLLEYEDDVQSCQCRTTREDFYKHKNGPFDEFAKSRHSIRNYSNADIDRETLEKAISLATTAPSACNRQHAEVYHISDPEKIARILELQGGCRGFGHLSKNLLVVAANLKCTLSIGERNDVYLNGGIFLMNLSYALHFHEVAHCILNWSKSDEEDARLRKIINIPRSSVVLAVLTCGRVPESFAYCCSPRKEVREVFKDI